MEKVFKPKVIELTKSQIADCISGYIEAVIDGVDHFNELFNTNVAKIPSEKEIEEALTDEMCQNYIDFVYDNKLPEWIDDDTIYGELYDAEINFYKELGVFQKLV